MPKASIRLLKEMEKVVFDKEFVKKFPNLKLYYVYRDRKKDADLRYDITLMPSRMLGREFVRTKGNRNSRGYQELYTVLKGKAIFLMQKAKGKIVEDIVAVEAKPGDWVIVPPNYAVITINPSKKTLKTGNWVSEKTKNIYRELEAMGGASYFAVAEKSKAKSQELKIKWIKNKNYQKIPKLRFEKPLKQRPENLDFLRKGFRS